VKNKRRLGKLKELDKKKVLSEKYQEIARLGEKN
jgi:hypothetical protein